MVDLQNVGRHKVKSVLVIGDVIADKYRECFLKKMCPDAPTVKAIVEHSVDLRAGGAANVAVNIAALAPDVKITLIGAVDVQLARAVKWASRNRVDMSYCSFEDEALTKERIMLDEEMVVRVDNAVTVSPLTAEHIEESLKSYLSEHDPDLVVLSDYGARSINQASMEILLDMRERLLVDTKLTDLSVFGSSGRKTRLVKLNYDEWKTVTSKEASPERFFSAMVMTRGDGGVYLSIRREVSEGKSVTHTLRVPAHEVEAVDVCGCGDTFLAGLAASLLNSDDEFTATQFANAAASTVVTKPRTAVADLGLTLKLLGREELE
jgi:D-beta-D-heptose 7-phosphate kinase/D-beta-D-heptose 1-phosphate adenosyltransferase